MVHSQANDTLFAASCSPYTPMNSLKSKVFVPAGEDARVLVFSGRRISFSVSVLEIVFVSGLVPLIKKIPSS